MPAEMAQHLPSGEGAKPLKKPSSGRRPGARCLAWCSYLMPHTCCILDRLVISPCMSVTPSMGAIGWRSMETIFGMSSLRGARRFSRCHFRLKNCHVSLRRSVVPGRSRWTGSTSTRPRKKTHVALVHSIRNKELQRSSSYAKPNEPPHSIGTHGAVPAATAGR